MKPGGGRAKGNNFERHVARLIVQAFREFGIKKIDCYRTPLSGGHLFASRKDPGDLVISPLLRKYFPYSVECKNDKRLDLERFFIPFKQHKKSWPEHQWLDQVLRATAGTDLQPLLVFKGMRTEIYCAVWPFQWTGGSGCSHLTFRYKGRDWVLLRFDFFLHMISSLGGKR